MRLAVVIRKNLVIRLADSQRRALKGFDQNQIETVARHVADRIASNPRQPLVAFAQALAEKATHIPNEFARNGEQALLDRISALPARTLWDVGANIGTWSRHALKVFPTADLHAFEIVPETFAELRQRLPADPRISLNPFGLSDRTGTVAVYLYSSNLISSMFRLERDSSVTKEIACPVERGADYAAARAIAEIDVLKIDVEGAEGKVLAGFEPMISERRIRLIQFEYNRGALLGDFLLKHAYAFFTPRGYRLGKLTPRGVHFHPYDFVHEDFLGPNYIACQNDDAELIRMIEWT
ncbi:MAG: FkbM family methyltransferase [Acetobacteraceae bacterium]